ncbi:hypothetical protein F4861DRAFT_495822 [Xylaria intraflava]|nr:hypothetical protein F4861DRAFT_495822 [Xylaria intraflava]
MSQSLQCHHVVRVLAVPASIVAARHLFAVSFHYPLLMLLAHVSIALAIEAQGAWGDTTNDEANVQKQPRGATPRLWQAIFAVVVAVGLIFTYHSFLHNRNTTLGVMLLGLDWAVVLGRAEKWLRQEAPRSVDIPLSIVTFSLCNVVLLWKENWLVGKGIEFLLIAVFCMAIARHLWVSGLVESPIDFGAVTIDAYGAGLAVCLPLATFLLVVTGWYNRRDFEVTGRILFILFSIITGSLSLMSASRLKSLTAPLQGRIPFHAEIDLDFGSPAFSLITITIVEIDNYFSQHRPSTTSGIQWLAFAIAYVSTLDTTWMTPSATSSAEGAPYTLISGFKFRDDPADHAKSPTPEETEAMYPPDFTYACESSWLRRVSLVWQTVLGALALFLVIQCAVGTPRAEPIRSWDLDIVIAWYDEPVDQVITTAQLVLEQPNIAGRKVRTIVYNKGMLNETNLEDNFPAGSSLIIRRLENVGREGDTYLSHILDSKQDWASHTLFIQAEPHDPSYLQARLEDYFVEETGFLSLSYVRNFCSSCDECNDHSGWSEDGKLLRDIFERSNPNKTCQDISLTYRGQFVVSSRRMKEANRELLQDCRSRVAEDEHFGFTLERSWGTLFRCPTISERCPTLLSGWIGNRAAIEDCQCLDRRGSVF